MASEACKWWLTGIGGTPRLFCAMSEQVVENKKDELTLYDKNAKECAKNRQEGYPPPGNSYEYQKKGVAWRGAWKSLKTRELQRG